MYEQSSCVVLAVDGRHARTVCVCGFTGLRCSVLCVFRGLYSDVVCVCSRSETALLMRSAKRYSTSSSLLCRHDDLQWQPECASCNCGDSLGR